MTAFRCDRITSRVPTLAEVPPRRSAPFASVAGTHRHQPRPVARSADARPAIREEDRRPRLLPGLLAAAVVAVGANSPLAALAVSGGGGAGNSLAFEDLSGKDFHGKKFYKGDLRGTNFSNANLENASLFGAFAKGASFKNANLANADLESVDFEDADLTGAVLEGAQVTNAQFKNVKIADTDWTDVVFRKDVQKRLCSIASGTNPKTGNDTKETLLC